MGEGLGAFIAACVVASVVLGVLVLALVQEIRAGMNACDYHFRRGWWCSRKGGHVGPCALRPSWWNLLDRYRCSGWY